MPEPVIDLRGLEPPEPLLRILEALEAGGPGPHVFLLAREPYPLYPLLAGQGWRRAVHLDEHGCELTLTRNPRIP
jgi:uncharacterized protein DUF2249